MTTITLYIVYQLGSLNAWQYDSLKDARRAWRLLQQPPFRYGIKKQIWNGSELTEKRIQFA